MVAYKIFYTATFESKLEKSERTIQEWLEKILDQLVENPFVGKPIRVKWFREKKFGKYRFYYLIFEDLKSVYFVNMSDKKNQQTIINSILLLLDIYKKELEELQKEN
jgi:mRNA-degrading endonuclease RelE of RelBE toxin-antitoxin system